MPMTFEQALRKGINQALFLQEMQKKAPKRKPMKVKAPPTGTLFAIRNKRLAIAEGAKRVVQIIITYTKITTGETKKYRIAPYSYRYRKLSIGYRKVLFGWDMDDPRIKSFVLNNIKNVVITDRKFTPKWPVEFG